MKQFTEAELREILKATWMDGFARAGHDTGMCAFFEEDQQAMEAFVENQINPATTEG